METMKKQWGKPLTSVQEFVPQEFIAACDQSGATQTYYFKCDAGDASGRYDVILDSNRNLVLDGEWSYRNGSWQWRAVNGNRDTWLTDGLYYHPCNETHTVTVPYGTSVENIFPHGWMQTKSSHSNNSADWTEVRIWRGDNNNNVHCTTNLKPEDFIPHNPS